MSSKQTTNLNNIAAGHALNNTLTHHAERPQGTEYLNNDYEKSPAAVRDFLGTVMVLAIRFALSEMTEKCFNTNTKLFPNLITAVCISFILYLFVFKKRKVFLSVLVFAAAFLLMSCLVAVFDILQEMTNVFYGETVILQTHEVLYRTIRFIIGGIFVLLFRKKYNTLNDNSNKDVYTSDEKATSRFIYIMFLFAPFCTLSELFLKLSGSEILVFIYGFAAIILVLMILTRILLGIGRSFRFTDRYGLVAYIFALLSIYEIIYTTCL